MPIAGSLTSIMIADADLRARFPVVDRWLPPEQVDWSSQIAAATADALDLFRLARDEDPEWVVPVTAESWKRLLVYQAYVVILEGMPGEEWAMEIDKWRGRFEEGLRALLYRVDEDQSGTLAEAIEERPQRIREIELAR